MNKNDGNGHLCWSVLSKIMVYAYFTFNGNYIILKVEFGLGVFLSLTHLYTITFLKKIIFSN
jgi:hypothetical protein